MSGTISAYFWSFILLNIEEVESTAIWRETKKIPIKIGTTYDKN
jgi:hypothetical protein